MKVRAAVGLGLCLAAGCAQAAPLPLTPEILAGEPSQDSYPERRVAFPGGVTGLADVTYAAIQGYRPLKLDLYLPPPSLQGPRPVVVYVHGGGWRIGSPRTTGAFADWPGVLASLAGKGYVVAAVTFRFSSEAAFPAPLQDVQTAIRWLRGQDETYNIDQGRFITWGTSSGAQLASLAAVACGDTALTAAAAAPESACVQGFAGWYGVYDFPGLYATDPSQDPADNPLFGCRPCTPEHLTRASPTTYVDGRDPPMLLIHGEADTQAPVSQSRIFHDVLTKAGVKTELVILPGVNHSWVGPTPAATRAASLEALQRTFGFIDATIGDRARP